jgi:phospholipase C
MTRKYLKTARTRLTSRRRAVQAMGSLLGAVVVGCGGNDPGGDGSGSSETGGGSSSGGGGSSSGDAPTSGGEVPTTSGATGSAEGTSSGGESSSEGSSEGEDSSTGEPIDECADGPARTPEELLAGIDHIIVLMMENRSFDHYFGARKLVEGLTVEGLTGDESNMTPDLVPVQVFPMDILENADPPHEWDECHLQFNLGENNGFVFEAEKKNPGFGAEVMGYFVREQLPVLYGLADNFTLCDRWFASVMGPTWPNRFYLHACSAGGQKENFPEPFLETLWHRCDDAGISSRVYFTDVPWVAGAFPLVPTVWGKLGDDVDGFNIADITNPNTLDRFFADCAAGTLPNFAIIDPGFSSNDDHPEHNISLGQILIGAIYKALAESPAWKKTMLVITYDEHGGFYDHVPPPQTVDDEPEFRQLGFRVPSLVIGPTVRRGCVNNLQFEHCSVGATLVKRFGLVPINERMATAQDLSACINPALIDDPQPGPPVPLVDISISDALAGVGHTTSQGGLHLALGVPLDEAHRQRVRAATLSLLKHAERLGVARLRA